MRAMVLQAPRSALVAADVPLPPVRADQVLIRVHACGVCRTDLHIVDGELERPKLSLIPGHQVVGTVARTGPRVERLGVGERVGVPWLAATDGTCRYCLRGQENLCEHALFTGYTVDGGYAEYMVASEPYCLPIPAVYDDVAAAPLLCAGLIGYRTYRLAGDNAEHLGIYGFGAAAHIIAQVAAAEGRRVYAFTRRGDTATQAFARELGAVWAGGTDEQPPVKLDAALIFAPVGALVVTALQATARGGVVVCGGIHMSDIPTFPYAALWEERVIRSVANLTRRDGDEFLALAARLPLRIHVTPFRLDQANEALEQLRHGQLDGGADHVNPGGWSIAASAPAYRRHRIRCSSFASDVRRFGAPDKLVVMLMGIQLGSYMPGNFGNHWDTTLAAAHAAEKAGLDSVWLADHFMFPDYEHPDRERPVFDCFVALGGIAATTTRIRIGELVVGVPYRNPVLLAKMLTTLDVMAHGRTIVGLGAAWHEPEFRAYGWPFPSVRDRMAMLEEAVQIVDRVLTQRPASFSGQHYTVDQAYNDPMPVQKPRPPIMIGGSGEKVTLRIAAQYGDFCNVGGDPDTVAHRYEVLRQHCERVGRPPEAIIRSNDMSILIAANEQELAQKKERYGTGFRLMGTPDQIVEGLQRYVRAGSQYVTFNMPDANLVEPILLFGETVLPEAARM